jgi:hypothetical protein
MLAAATKQKEEQERRKSASHKKKRDGWGSVDGEECYTTVGQLQG